MRIEYLELKTSQLEKQQHFYGEVLGLAIRHFSATSFEVQIGFSVLKFTQHPTATAYHVAFHIGAYQEQLALDWLKQRVGILRDGPEEIIDFSAWNAKSLYFYDTDQNVLEFISRRHLHPTSAEKFDAGSVLGISEIGLATDNVLKNYTYLHEQFGLTKFTGDYEVFCATGDENGLFIIADSNKKTWFPSGDKAVASDFCIRIATSQLTAALQYKAGTLRRQDLNEY